MDQPKYDDEEIIAKQSVNGGLLSVRAFTNALSESLCDISDDNIRFFREALRKIKALLPKLLEKYPVHYCEYVQRCLQDRNYRAVFEFAVDNELEELVHLCMNRKYDEVMPLVKRLFFICNEDRKKQAHLYANTPYMQAQLRAGTISSDDESIRYQQPQVDIDVQKNKSNIRDNKKYDTLLMTQYSGCPFFEMDVPVDGFIEACEEGKKKLYEELISNTEDRLERYTGEKKAREEYEKVFAEISDEYIRNLLKKDNIETPTIKLAVKLEAALRYRGFTGDLMEMLDAYCKTYYALHNCTDDEDSDYYRYREEDEENRRRDSLLHKLRMARNSLVHSGASPCEITEDELLQCMTIINNM